MNPLKDLNDAYRIPGTVEVIADRGGMPAIWVQGSHASEGASAIIYLHGGHVASWRPAGAEEVLWLSAKSHWQADRPIRGGVPLCFPWFGPHASNVALPAHGFARLREWRLESIEMLPPDQAGGGGRAVAVTLGLHGDEKAEASMGWPHAFVLRHRVVVGRTLAMMLEVENRGTNPLSFEAAAHSYFAVGDVKKVQVKGLSGRRYIDKVDGRKEKSQEGDITITSETDRVYLEATGPVTIEDPLKRRAITVHGDHVRNVVLWNPWIDKARAMPDFGDDEWPQMLCVETANVGNASVTLSQGQRHAMTTRIVMQAM